MNCPTSKPPAQRDKILALLRERGSAGVSNRELNAIGYRYGARLWELRKQGFRIATLSGASEGEFRFALLSEPIQAIPVSKYNSRTREIEAEALPLFAGVR